MTDLETKLRVLIASDRVVLFMKGTRAAPQCGFSASVVDILDELLERYTTVDVLKDPDVREGVKQLSSWPTIPQLYVDAKFVGGADIVKEMHRAGELASVLGASPAPVKTPTLTVTERAQAVLADASRDSGNEPVHLRVSGHFEHDLFVGPKEQDELEARAGTITICIDRASARRADGIAIDFVESANGAGFKIDNPNEPARVQRMSVRELATMIADGAKFELFDVRPDDERALASHPRATPLDDAGQAKLESLDRSTPVVFMCHTGVRSRRVAEHFLREGFRRVYNLEGGIDAWSEEIDATVPKY